MLHTKFRGNRSSGSGEEDFLRVFTIYGRGGHLCHVTIIMSADFHCLVPENFHTKFGTVVSEKIWFEFLYVHDLDLQYSYAFIHLFRCLLLPIFRSLAAIVSEKSTVFTFSYRKA